MEMPMPDLVMEKVKIWEEKDNLPGDWEVLYRNNKAHEFSKDEHDEPLVEPEPVHREIPAKFLGVEVETMGPVSAIVMSIEEENFPL